MDELICLLSKYRHSAGWATPPRWSQFQQTANSAKADVLTIMDCHVAAMLHNQNPQRSQALTGSVYIHEDLGSWPKTETALNFMQMLIDRLKHLMRGATGMSASTLYTPGALMQRTVELDLADIRCISPDGEPVCAYYHNFGARSIHLDRGI